MSNITIGSSAARESWIRLLNALRDELRNILPDANIVHNEEEFRTKFLELDEELHVRDPAVNYGIFGRYHDSVHLFARTIDDTIGLQTSPTLKELFWTVALAAIEAAFAQDFEFKELPAIYKDLTREFPSFTDVDLSQYPQDIRVQECLQKIFEAYLKCYLELVCQFDTDPDERDFQAVADQIGRASTTYAKQEAKWKSVTETARSEAEVANSRNRGINDAFRFERLRVLGKGSYGEVDVVRQTTTGSVYARKQIPFNAGGTEPSIITERVKNEVEVMTRLRHHHIASVNLWFRAESTWTILMLPVAEYDLRTFLDEKCVKQNYPPNMLRLIDTWFGCLISALKYAHERRVKHEDIKPSNILVLRNTVYLTDFGTAKHFTELEASTATDFLEQGTPIYWAPEDRPWGRPADVFALGCVFAEMLTVRQGRSLAEFREFRYTRNTGFGYAYRACLEKVIIWLRDRIGIGAGDPVAQTILEQTMNMLEPEVNDRPEAARVKRQLGIEPERLFCNICS